MFKSAIYATALVATGLLPVIAHSAPVGETVLRLPATDQIHPPVRQFQLRPRLPFGLTRDPDPAAGFPVTVEDAGRVGKFAYVPTAHPSVVVSVGAVEDRSELGRQIDRALMTPGSEPALYRHPTDSAPFVGIGVRSDPEAGGWKLDASVGVGMFNPPDAARLMASDTETLSNEYDVKARAHLRLRYTF